MRRNRNNFQFVAMVQSSHNTHTPLQINRIRKQFFLNLISPFNFIPFFLFILYFLLILATKKNNIYFAHTQQLSLWFTFSFDFNVALDFVKVIEKTWNGGAPLIISQLWTIISVSILIQWATFLYCYKSGRISPLTAAYPQPGPRQKVRHHTYLSLLQQSFQRELMGANSSCFFFKSFFGISLKHMIMNSFSMMFREALLK